MKFRNLVFRSSSRSSLSLMRVRNFEAVFCLERYSILEDEVEDVLEDFSIQVSGSVGPATGKAEATAMTMARRTIFGVDEL